MSTVMKSLSTRRSHAPVGRPNTHIAEAHPRRVSRGLPRQTVASCIVDRREVRSAGTLTSRWSLRIKSLAIGFIAVAGGVVGVTGYVSAVADMHATPDASDAAAWAHVEP
ncbi:hypothetical protein [uncultured Tessaracoccus sp.]|uniref:hypothetical protein n=1 Tax=uncultured Tessaracoccus sp. TaxID=905023 RepID=UPI002613279C|nr:hypothetical protein [uncultured Tessaracoccus sp.]